VPDPLNPDFGELFEVANPEDGLHPWITSLYGGICKGCGNRFEAGELIRRYDPEEGYLAECCGADPP
jgi:hypothetical protein